MKILWLSNKVLTPQDCGVSGTWLDAMAGWLITSGCIQLGNITVGQVSEVVRQDHGLIQQWVVPPARTQSKDGLPPSSTVKAILKAVDRFAPDLVHVWGTENFWGLFTARSLIGSTALLEMQGLKRSISDVYNGGLSTSEQIACIGVKELLRKNTIFQAKKQFKRWGAFEREMIANHNSITVQSDWMEAQVRAHNHECCIYRTERVLRQPFYDSAPWRFSENPVFFCSAAYSAPFKGLHVAVRALAIVKRHYPSVQLHIAGAHQINGLRRDGYIAWIANEVRRLGLQDNVKWLGTLTAVQIVEELQKCSAILLPTFVESYCLALAEAMRLGVPAVVSYTGGTSFLSKDEETSLFFNAGDEAMCAHQLSRVLSDRKLSMRLSEKSRAIAFERNNPDKILSNQLATYQHVMNQRQLCCHV